MRLGGDHCHDLVGDQCHDLDGDHYHDDVVEDHCHDLVEDHCPDLDGDHDDGIGEGEDGVHLTGDTEGSPSLCQGGEGAQGREV